MRSAPAAVVFDCDGLLLATEDRWTIAESEVLARHGGTWSPELKRQLIGTGIDEASNIFARWLGLPEAAGRALGEEMTARFGEVLAERGVEPMPGAAALVEQLRDRVPIAVASNTPAPLVAAALAASGLPDVFDAVVCAGGGLANKPQPDVYIEACRRLGVAPRDAVALEDSRTGAAAARAAGMWVVVVPSLPDLEVEADLVVASLEVLDAKQLGLT